MERLAPEIWVVVCDGRRAVIMRNRGDAYAPNLQVLESLEHDGARTSELGSDRPGRVHESGSTARSSVEQTDFHDLAEAAFLRGLAEKLDAAARRGEMPGLILAAPPRALGMLRPVLSGQVQALLREEIAHDYVKMPVQEIERHLTEAR